MRLIQIEDTNGVKRYVNPDAISTITQVSDDHWLVGVASCDDFYVDRGTLLTLMDEIQSANSETESDSAW